MDSKDNESDVYFGFAFCISEFDLKYKIGEHIGVDDLNREYKLTYKYMENNVSISPDMIMLLHDQPIYVVKIIDYIVKNMPYNTNRIILKNKIISDYANIDECKISKGIRILKELNIIVKAKDLDYYKYENIPNKLYIVNHNYILKGSFNKLIKSINEQKEFYNKRLRDIKSIDYGSKSKVS